MNEVRNILIGLEIRDDITRVSYYDRTLKEPVVAAARVGTNLFEFPTAVAKVTGKDEYVSGFDALAGIDGIGTERLPSPLSAAKSGEDVSSRDGAVSPGRLMAGFIGGILGSIGISDIQRCVGGIAVVTREVTHELAGTMREAFSILHLPASACFIEDEDESLYYFGYSQKAPVSSRNMALLTVGDTAVMKSMTEMRAHKPSKVFVSESFAIPLKNAPDPDAVLAARIEDWGGGADYSGIFISGAGFRSDIFPKTVKALSKKGGRVFAADFIFVRGACWTCVERLERRSFGQRVYDGPHSLTRSLGLDVIIKDKQVWYPLIKEGDAWHESLAECQIILKGRKDLTFTLASYDGDHTSFKMDLPGLPERPDGTTRLLIRAECPDAGSAVVTVKDLGFGEMFPRSGLTWTRETKI